MAYEVELEDGTILEFSTMPTQANIMAAKGLMKGHPPTKDFNLKDALVGGWAQAGNAVDLAASTLLGHSAMQAGNQQFVDSLEEGRKNREEIRNSWTDQTKPPGFAEKAVGLAASFPGQVVTSGLASTTSTKTMLDAGESANRALAAGGVSAVGNTAMLAVPALRGADWIGTALANFGLGAAQDAGTKAVIQQIAQTKKGKEAFEPHAEDAFLSGLVGAGIGVAAIHGTPRAVTPSAKPKGNPNGNPESAYKAWETPPPVQETGTVPQNSTNYTILQQEKQKLLQDTQTPEVKARLDQIETELLRMNTELAAQKQRESQGARESAFVGDQATQGRVAESPMDRVTRELGGEPTPRPLSPLESVAQRLTTEKEAPSLSQADRQRQLDVQNELNQRQQALEFDVKQRAGLDFNAAERARQEAAPSGAREAAADTQMSQEHQSRMGDAKMSELSRQLDEVQAAIDAERQKAQTAAEQAKLDAVQRQIDERRAQMEFEVKQRTTLEMQAADRARQEAAPSGFPEWQGDRAVESTADRLLKGAPEAKRATEVGPEIGGERQLNNLVLEQRANEHPFVKAAEERVAKQEQLIVKLSEQVQNGKASPARLAKEMKNLQHLEEGVSKVRENVMKGEDSPPTAGLGKRALGHKQGGAIDPDLLTLGLSKLIKPGEGKKVEALKAAGKTWSDILGVMHHAERTPEDVISLAKEGKDINPNAISQVVGLFTKSKLMVADKAQHPVVTFAAHTALEAERKANALVQHVVHDSMAPAARKLSNEALVNIKKVMDYADLKQRKITKEFLEQHGFNPDQIHYWEVTSGGHKQAFASLNKGRVAMGLEPLTERQGYSVMMANGEFKRLVMDKATDEVVGVVSADSRSKLNERAEAMRQKGYTVGKEMSYVGDRRTVGGSEFMQVLESLAGNDPRVAQFLDVMHDVYKGESMRYMGMDKRMMDKKGVFGTTGRKPWLSELENAKEFANAQVAYVEHALRFGELAEAKAKLDKVLLDKDVAENHSNAAQAAKEMMDSAMGINPSDIGKTIDAVARQLAVSTGWGGMRANTAFQAAKKFISYKFFALNPQYYVASLLQPMAAIPAIKQVLASRGLDLMFDGGTGSTYLARGGLTMLKAASAKEALSPIERGAVEYNRTHHVYGSDLMQQSSATRNSAGHIADVALTYVPTKIESATRGQVFYSLVHMLSENGMTAKEGLYKTAHNYTDAAMVNYARSERARIHDMAGPMGELTSHIAAYKAHQISMLNYFAREIGRQMKQGDAGGTVQAMRPLAAAMISQVVFAGLRGLPLYAEINEIVKYLSKELGSPTSLNEYMFELADKIGGKFSTGISNGVFSLLNHVHKDIPGVDTSNAMGMGNTIPDSVGEAFWTGAVDTGKTIASIWNAGKNRDEVSTKAMLRELAPPLVRNWMDQAWFTDHNTDKGQLAHNPDNVNKTYQRTENDRKAKMFGFTGIEEAKNKTQLYDNQTKKMAYEEIRTKAIQQASREFYAHKTISDEAIAKYMKAEGDPKALDSDIQRMVKAQNMDTATAELLKTVMSKRISSLNNARRMAETRNANQR